MMSWHSLDEKERKCISRQIKLHTQKPCIWSRTEQLGEKGMPGSTVETRLERQLGDPNRLLKILVSLKNNESLCRVLNMETK